MNEILRDSYRNFDYVVVETTIDDGSGNQVLNGYEVYLKEETNPKVVFPDDLAEGNDWEKIKGDIPALRHEIEKCLDAEVDNIKQV